MRLNYNVYKYYTKFTPVKNVQTVKKMVAETIDSSDIKVALRDSRVMNSATCKSKKLKVLADIFAGISQKVKNTVSKYPKGTFERTNTVYIFVNIDTENYT